MLRPLSEFRELSKNVKRYSDPELQRPGVLMHLLFRLHMCGRMLAATANCVETVDFFSVVKKVQPYDETPPSSASSGTSSSKGPPRPAVPWEEPTPPLVVQSLNGMPFELIPRLIMDERYPNVRWRAPPRVQLTSPEVVGDVDMAASRLEGGSVAVLKADAPDYYYTLRVEEWMLPFFVVAGITVTAFNTFPASQGAPLIPCLPGQDYLAVCVLLMGWGWSVWTAETVLEDLLIRGSTIFLASSRLFHGAPAPEVGPRLPIPWFTHIDDLGAWIWGSSDEDAHRRGRLILAELRRIFKEAGLALHKEELSFRLEIVGLETGRGKDERYRVMAKPQGIAELMVGTHALLDQDLRGGVSPKAVESTAGHWAFRCLVNRAGFAIFFHLYLWLRRFANAFRARLWPGLRAELKCIQVAGPALFMEQDLAWAGEAFCVDASNPGYATCVTDAEEAELRAAGRWAEQKGWFFPVHKDGLPPAICATEVSPSDGEGDEGTGTSSSEASASDPLAKLKAQERGAWKAWEQEASSVTGTLELLSGTRAWSRAVRVLGRYRAVEVDLSEGPHCDISISSVQSRLIQELHGGEHWAVLLSLPAGSFGRSTNPPLRSVAYPCGLPSLLLHQQQRVEAEDELPSFALNYCELVRELGAWYFLEWAAGGVYEAHPAVHSFDRRMDITPSNVDFCFHGAPILRRTSIRTNAEWSKPLWQGCPGCPSHLSTRLASAAERAGAYPSSLAERWAEFLVAAGPSPEFVQHFPSRTLHLPNVPFSGGSDVNFRPETKILAPSLPGSWDDVRRWKIAIRGLWRRREHINVLEARAALQAVRRAARNPRNWRKKVLGLTDSEVVRGCFSKGRSSSSSRVGPCRRLAAIQLGLRLKMRWRRIETTRNNSDLPSRGGKVPGVK